MVDEDDPDDLVGERRFLLPINPDPVTRRLQGEMTRNAKARYKDPKGKVGVVETIKPHPLAEWFSPEELAIMASVQYDRNRDNGSLMKCDYTPRKP